MLSCAAQLRHPVATRGFIMAASVAMGVATGIVFANTRTWKQVLVFVAGTWFSFLSKLWMASGSRGADSCKLLSWYSWFMSTGKPWVQPGVTKAHLRGFEIQAQNFGTTFGLVVILGFYPIAKMGFGDQSMIYKLLYQTDMSITFLLVALANEIIENRPSGSRGTPLQQRERGFFLFTLGKRA